MAVTECIASLADWDGISRKPENAVILSRPGPELQMFAGFCHAGRGKNPRGQPFFSAAKLLLKGASGTHVVTALFRLRRSMMR